LTAESLAARSGGSWLNGTTARGLLTCSVAARKLEDEENMARERVRAAWWAIAVAALCWAGAAHAQTTSLDREVKAASGRAVRVGIYTSMRADCTAGPLPAIRLSVAPAQRRHCAPRDDQSHQCQAMPGR